jgi:hypothetical protein
MARFFAWFWGVIGPGVTRFLLWLGATLIRASVVVAAGWLIYWGAQQIDWTGPSHLVAQLIFFVVCIGLPIAIMAKGSVPEAAKDGKKIGEKLADRAWTALWRAVGDIVLWVFGIQRRER